MPDRDFSSSAGDSLFPREWIGQLRAPVDLGPAARARVMMSVRAAAALARGRNEGMPRARGAVRPTVLGALLAASFVVSIVTAGANGGSDGSSGRTLADTIAVHFAIVGQPVRPVIDRERMVAVADATSEFAPRSRAASQPRRD